MEQVRILMSAEKRHCAYGEAIAEAIGALRPHMKVSVVAPEGFEEEMARLWPELVVCDRPDPAGPVATLAWVKFLADTDRPAAVHVGGHCRELVNPPFIELLSFLDEAWTLARTMPVGA